MSASATITSDTAVLELHPEEVTNGALLKATEGDRRVRGRLPRWRGRKVGEYIDSYLSGPILVADPGALVGLSEGHFARSFKHTLGMSPYAFVVRRRLELAA